MTRFLPAATVLLFAGALSACGLTGDLKRPGPLIGTPSGNVKPAELPEGDGSTLPPLPERPKTQEAPTSRTSDDELLGGPGSR